jgi:hypothetical protein
MHPFHHSQDCVRRFGGKPEDYQTINNWFDESKAHYAGFAHRALRHHTLGIFECEQKFGVTILNSDGKPVPVRFIGERHVLADCGFIPTLADWLRCVQQPAWMRRVGARTPEEGEGLVDTEKVPDASGHLAENPVLAPPEPPPC